MIKFVQDYTGDSWVWLNSKNIQGDYPVYMCYSGDKAEYFFK
jgi:hypothetical protein